MKHIFFLVLALGLTPCISRAQTDAPDLKPLEQGDQVPDLVFHQMVNYSDSIARLSDFEGKAVLLDFWATWCVPCVNAFPKLEKIQQKYKDDLKIILVAVDKQEILRKFYSHKEGLTLPSAVSHLKKDTIRHLFPHREVPHVIWIGKDRKIHAITAGVQLTEEAVDAWMAGKLLNLPRKNDLAVMQTAGVVIDSIETHAGMIRRISVDSAIRYQSVFRKYDPRLTAYSAVSNNFVEFINGSPAFMTMFAYGFRSRAEREQVLFDLKDTNLLGTYDEHIDEWHEKYACSYRIILEKPDSTRLYRRMQYDFGEMYGLWAYQKKVRIPCLVLRKYGNKAVPRAEAGQQPNFGMTVYHMEFINQPMEKVIYHMRGYDINTGKIKKLKEQQALPLFDETGITYNVSFKLENIENTKDADILNKSLRTIGLELVPAEREMNCLIVTDKPKEEVMRKPFTASKN